VESGSSRLAAALAVGDLVVTADLLPPRSGAPAALADIADQAVCLKGIVTALNVADMPSGMLAQSPWAAASLLAARSLEPIYQMSCRDRGRLALQGDLLGAAALGIVNVLCLTGDHPRFGDHPGSRPVFDLSSTELLAAATALNRGTSLEDVPLEGAARLFPGAVVNPGQEPLEPQLRRAAVKVRAGARFFQTQPLFLPAQGEQFLLEAAEADLEVPVLLGTFLLEGAGAARYMNERVPGVRIPQSIISGLERASNPKRYGLEVVREFLIWVFEKHGNRRRTDHDQDSFQADTQTGSQVSVRPPYPAGAHVMSRNRFSAVAATIRSVRESVEPAKLTESTGSTGSTGSTEG